MRARKVFARLLDVAVGTRAVTAEKHDCFVEPMRRLVGQIIVLETIGAKGWYWRRPFNYHASWLKIYGREAAKREAV
jgi:heme A synthase